MRDLAPVTTPPGSLIAALRIAGLILVAPLWLAWKVVYEVLDMFLGIGDEAYD